MLIGFGYKAWVGKDESSDYLRDNYGFKKTAFSANLKECCKEVFGLTNEQVYDGDLKQKLFDRPVVCTQFYYDRIIEWMSESLGFTIYRIEYLYAPLIGFLLRSPRDILQFVGTDVMRAHCNNYHIITCLRDVSGDEDYVISDVRFSNEAQAVLDFGGKCVKVVRDTGYMNSRNKNHKSEVDLDSWFGWSAILDNKKDGLDCLHSNIDLLLEDLNVR